MERKTNWIFIQRTSSIIKLLIYRIKSATSSLLIKSKEVILSYRVLLDKQMILTLWNLNQVHLIKSGKTQVKIQ